MPREKDIKILLSGNVLEILNAIERFQGFWQGQEYTVARALINQLRQTSIITSSGASTRIEGALISDQEVEKLVERGCQITELSSRSEREVAGYIECLQYIYKNFANMRLSEYLVREIHQMLMSHLTEEQIPSHQRGAYKNVSNDVVEKNEVTGDQKLWFRTMPPGPQTAAAMAQLIKDHENLKNEGMPALVGIATFVVHFLAIHPFRDGNGRLSRLLTLLLLLREGYSWAQFVSHEKFIEDNKEAYYVSLRKTQETLYKYKQDYQPWYEFFFTIILRQTEYLKGEIDTRENMSAKLNSNEQIVYKVVSKAGPCPISFIERHINMSREGLKDLLARLVERGFLVKIGEKKGAKYKISGDMHEGLI